MNADDKVLKKKNPNQPFYSTCGCEESCLFSIRNLSTQIGSGHMCRKTIAGIVLFRWYHALLMFQWHLNDTLSASTTTTRGFLQQFQQSNRSSNSYSNSKRALLSVPLANLNSNCDAEDARMHPQDCSLLFKSELNVNRQHLLKRDKAIHTIHVWRRYELIRGDLRVCFTIVKVCDPLGFRIKFPICRGIHGLQYVIDLLGDPYLGRGLTWKMTQAIHPPPLLVHTGRAQECQTHGAAQNTC